MEAETLGALALVLTAIGTITTPIAIAYFGRKTVQATTEGVAVNKAVLTEVRTANAKPSGGVVDAIWDEQIRLKRETGVDLEADETEHAESMERHKRQ